MNSEDPASSDVGTASVSDAELIASTRQGDAAAFGQLYERHVDAAVRLSRILAKDRSAADDLVSETFEKVLAALRAGKGPDVAFRAYLLTTLRNSFYTRAKRDKKVEFTDDLNRLDSGEAFVDPAVAGQERRYAANAFAKLPERWQVVLWHTEVEGDTAAQIAPLLGLTPNAVSALAYRARERLKELYLQAHIEDTPAAACRWTSERLGAKVRGGLSARDERKVDGHLDECAACKLLYMELAEVNSGIGVLVAPVAVGVAAPVYLASSSSGAAVAGWFGGVFGGVAEGGRHAVVWVQKVLGKLSGRNGVIAGGATAVVAAALALILVANTAPPGPPPDASAPADEAPADEEDSPDDPDSPDDEPDEEEEPDEEPDEDDPAVPTEYSINVDPSAAGLIAGGEGTLPVSLSAPDDSGSPRVPVVSPRVPPVRDGATPEHARVAPDRPLLLKLVLPAGVTSPGGDASDGWRCESGSTITCERAELKPGQSTIAYVPLSIEPTVTGFQEVAATVTRDGVTSEATLRFPVSPPTTVTAYAAEDATGVTATGNTLLTCTPQPLCGNGLADNHLSLMGPYTAEGAPGQAGKRMAVSGARLSIPDGAEVLWAGLYWTTSRYSTPASVRLATPGGGWQTIGEQRAWDGPERPVRQSAATVTGLIGSSGEYWIAADEEALPSGPSHYAGWSLTVVYRQGGAEPKETAVYEGLAQPRHGENLSVNVPGGDMDIAYTLWDGDRLLTGDSLMVGGIPVCVPGNIGSSRAPGALEGEGWHTFGVDVDVCRVSVPPGPTNVSVTVGLDPLEIGVLAVSTRRP